MSVFGDLISGAGYVADTPGALLRGLLSGRPGERASGRDMLESWGLVAPNQAGLDAGDVGGLLADLLVDPLNVVGTGFLTKALKANRSIKSSNKLSQGLRAAGAMPEEVAKLTKVVDEVGKPKKMFHGTASVFDRPDSGFFDPHALYQKGHYTTDTPAVSSGYSMTVKPGQDLPRNVQTSYLDIRNPIDMDAPVASADLVRQLTSGAEIDPQMVQKLLNEGRRNEVLKLADAGDQAGYAAALQKLQAENLARGDAGALFQQKYGKQAGSIPLDEVDSRWIKDAEFANDYSQVFNQGSPWLPEPHEVGGLANIRQAAYSHPSFETLRNEDLYRAVIPEDRLTHGYRDVNRLLQDAGYDGILHRGGGRIGDVDHNVAIAFDPSQVYAPWIAPALQPTRSTNPLIAGLLGYNAAKLPARSNRQ